MKPRERRDTGEQDLFRSRLDQIINLKHELVKLAEAVSWPAIEAKCGEAYTDGPGMPPLPTRLMAGLAILKFTFDLSDEELCARWVENPYFQYFCGEQFFCHELPFDRSSLTRWRQRMGEERLMSLLQESLAVAIKTGAMAPQDTRQVVIDTTVQAKNVMFPTDAKLLNRAREKLVRLAKHTRAAFEALGIEPDSAATSDDEDATAPIAKGSRLKTKAGPAKDGAPRTRADSKQAKLIDMLNRPDGATIEEIATALGWQSHTVRGAIAGALKKKLGLNVASQKIEGRVRVYKIV